MESLQELIIPYLPWLGWVATACFTLSFFFKTQVALMRCQMFAACLWISYGVLRQDYPVITANVLVAGASVINLARFAWQARKAAAVVPAANAL